jgi:hypothetical protein
MHPIDSCPVDCVGCGEAQPKPIWGFGLLASGWDVHWTSSEDPVGSWRCPACVSGRSPPSTSIRGDQESEQTPREALYPSPTVHRQWRKGARGQPITA